jgi:hypothetical protein
MGVTSNENILVKRQFMFLNQPIIVKKRYDTPSLKINGLCWTFGSSN